MAKWDKKTNIKEKPAGDQIYAFATCGNFPKERAGLEALATALESAAQATGLTMSSIVDECVSSSAWCPTPFDLRQVAVSMKQQLRESREGSKHAEWYRLYGPPQPAFSSGLLEELLGREKSPQERREAIRDQAIRDTLYCTEGDGRELGDREFWAAARKKHLRDNLEHVNRIREEGGWRTERELQGAA